MKKWPIYAIAAVLLAALFVLFVRFYGHDNHCPDWVLFGVMLDVLGFGWCVATALHLHWWENLGR